MTNLTSLIAKLEQAESGSRELDAEIARGLGWTHRGIGIAHVDNDKAWFDQNGHQVRLGPPQFSTSVDAALTLVPEGWRITHAYGPPWAWCLTKTAPEEDGSRRYAEGKSATPALALTIASLKARMAQL